MKKIRFLFIALVITISLNCITPVIFAAEENETSDTQLEEENKEEILLLIDEYIQEINTKLNIIDKKIANTKVQKEFEYYPAIRLNVDTPMFGLSAIVENKLRIKKDISTSDVAAKYSIRDVVKDKKIRLPESYLGAIVMSTKEIDIDSTMTLPQAKLTLVKCIQYLSQVNGVSDFIDTQTNNIFKDYISSTKKSNMKDIKDRVKKVSAELVDISDKITKLEFLGVDVEEYKTTYWEISKELYSIKNNAKNTLILDTELNDLMKNSLTNESSVIDLNTKITELYDSTLEEIDYELLLKSVSAKYEEKVDEMNSYIENSTKTTKKVTDGKEEKVTIVNYEVTSIATLDYMQLVLDDINTQISDLNKEAKEAEKEENSTEENTEEKESENKTKEQIQQEKQLKIEENTKKIDTLYSKYKEVLSREYKFYTSNINMLLKDSNDKVSSVISEIDSGIEVKDDIFTYTKYIYLDLPENLEKYIDENSIDSTIELENLIKLLKKEITDLSNKNKNITNLYNEILEEALKS